MTHSWIFMHELEWTLSYFPLYNVRQEGLASWGAFKMHHSAHRYKPYCRHKQLNQWNIHRYPRKLGYYHSIQIPEYTRDQPKTKPETKSTSNSNPKWPKTEFLTHLSAAISFIIIDFVIIVITITAWISHLSVKHFWYYQIAIGYRTFALPILPTPLQT